MSVGERTPLILSDNSNINDHDVFSEDGQLVDISDKGEKEIWDFVIAFPGTCFRYTFSFIHICLFLLFHLFIVFPEFYMFFSFLSHSCSPINVSHI